MGTRTLLRLVCLALLSPALQGPAAAEDFADALHAHLRHVVEAGRIPVGVVVGLVDERGPTVVGHGRLDNGTDLAVDGDTLFEIGSVTKTFTAVLLQDMVERGELGLDDPAATHLPRSVRMPGRGGITLRQLATHTSGLPYMPDNLDPTRADNPYADYDA